MREIVVATKNQGKMREIKSLLEDLGFRVTSLADYPDAPNIVEDGKTFAQNAIKKAVTIAFYTKKLVMGEDSGIEIKALNNRPGIFSARYAGENATDRKNNLKLLRELKNVPFKKRQARYRCFIALADTKGFLKVVSGSCLGLIEKRHRGKNGFGYDPLFFIPRYNKTFGELDPAIKAQISHRARALQKAKKVLQEY
ncbi:MAG TPA: XTP/dITP diphosphatase [Candidatus Omnitrophota bacterium]|nr:XTP/dITP diphosphatase [Candidatus Omnitrophota bacterium]HPN87981.1 XTP/dITP diphosphatase [Candidatus Omnitrophota bacterium]